MSKFYLKLLLNFVLLLLTQIFVLSKINMFGYITPMIYIVFIFSLPFQMSRNAVILLGFLMGMIVDIFSYGVLGIHALATLMIAFIRPLIIYTIPVQIERDEHLRPILVDMKFKWYLRYAIVLTFIHHSIYFLIDMFNFDNLLPLIIAILLNTLFSTICIILIQIFFYKPMKRY